MKKIYNTIKRNYNTSPFGTLLLMILAAPLIIITEIAEFFNKDKKIKNYLILDLIVVVSNIIWLIVLLNLFINIVIKLLGLIFSI